MVLEETTANDLSAENKSLTPQTGTQPTPLPGLRKE